MMKRHKKKWKTSWGGTPKSSKMAFKKPFSPGIVKLATKVNPELSKMVGLKESQNF